MAKISNNSQAYGRPFVRGTTEQIFPSSYQPGASNVIWQWNETNVTQFDSIPYIFSEQFTAIPSKTRLNITSQSVAYLNTLGIGNRARFQWTFAALAGGCMLYRMFDDAGANLTVPNRFKIRYRIALADNMKCGFFVYADAIASPPTGMWGIGIAQLPTTTAAEVNRAEGGFPTTNTELPWISAGATPISSRAVSNTATPAIGSWYEDIFEMDPATASTTPYVTWTHWSPAGQTAGNTGTNAPTNAQMIGVAPVAGWTGRAAMNKLGIYFITNRPTGATAQIQICELQVLKHDMDADL